MPTATTSALTLCNACDVEPTHGDCSMGYCSNCCPAVAAGHPNH